MKQAKAQKIVIIGCGNLGWHLALKLSELKHFDLHVYNHRPSDSLKEFSTKLKCRTFDSISNVISDAAFYFLCVPDRMITDISKKLETKGLVLHCSGTKNINDISSDVRGVLYPVQTFSKHDKIEWKDVPILIEANSKSAEKNVRLLAENFSKKIILVSSEERIQLHLAAVIVNNFTNALYVAADDYLSSSSKKLKFELLLPLIKQTVKKLDSLTPLQAQTGPAKRGDSAVMETHLDLLKDKKRLKKTYKQISKLIEQQHAIHA